MAVNQRTNAAFIVLGLVSAGVIGYFIWTFLAPLPMATESGGQLSTEVKTDIISNDKFRGLEPYADLPIIPTNVGRPDPFMPFLLENTNTDLNQNINAN